MNWILALVAFLKYAGTNTTDMTANQQIHLYLTQLVGLTNGLIAFALVGMVLGVFIAVVGGTRKLNKGLGCGCIIAIVGIILFLGTIIGHLLATGMLASFDPIQGVIDPVKFYLCLGLFVLTGAS